MNIPFDHRTISLMLEKAMHKKYYQVTCMDVQKQDMEDIPNVTAVYAIHFRPLYASEYKSLWVEFTRDTVALYKPKHPKNKLLVTWDFKYLKENPTCTQQAKINEMVESLMDDIETSLQEQKL